MENEPKLLTSPSPPAEPPVEDAMVELKEDLRTGNYHGEPAIEPPEPPKETRDEREPAPPEPPAAATPTPASKTAPPKEPEMVVTIISKGNRIMLAVKSTDCDPVYDTLTGDLAAALAGVPALMEKAEVQWKLSKHYPKAPLPPPPPPRPKTPVAMASKPVATTPTKPAAPPPPKLQPRFF